MKETSSEHMRMLLDVQRQAYLKEGVVSAAVRADRLARAADLVAKHRHRFCEAMSADFGHRSMHQSMLADIIGAVAPLKHAKANVAKWMRPERRRAEFPFGLLGASTRIDYQPLGVVGCISPWNFPVQLTFAPLAGILAAGNRAMIKPSEYTPETSQAMAEAFAEAFDETEVAVIQGGPQTGADFSGLPFDHLIFTGATSIAKHVMRAAAENLVPVTLELGGKSPVIVAASAPMEPTTDAIVTGKMMNAGQMCLAPDYVFVPEQRIGELVESTKQSVTKLYPTLLDNDDYTSIINERHHQRLQGLLEDARDKGAEVVEINPAHEDFRRQPHFKMPPALVMGATDDMQIMQEEIFGPLMPVKGYGRVGEAIDYVNGHPRPLGLYYFGQDRAEEDRVLSRTTSGGVTVNDVIMHVTQEDLPFGGVGPAGMGSYHGVFGFRNFSHAKAVYRQSRVALAAFAVLRPPYTEKLVKMVEGRLGV